MNRNRFEGIWMPLALALALSGGFLLGGRWGSPIPKGSHTTAEGNISLRRCVGKTEEVLRYLDAKYVDAIDKDSLEEAAISAILDKLDPHTSYIPRRDIAQVNESLEGSFEGIGVRFYMLRDTMLVVAVVPDGPSAKAGIKAGDRILSVEDSLLCNRNLTNDDLVRRLRGRHNSEARLKVLRRGTLQDFVVKRDMIADVSVDAHFMLTPTTGYIQISRFSSTTYEEFMKAMEQLIKDKAMKNLVIDLRQNPGGYLTAATRIADQLFTEKGKLIVYTENRNKQRIEYKTNGRSFFALNNISVLIDEGSASASEILAGCLQDHDRATLLGRRSFGKGLVQEQYPLSDGSALRMTVGRYFTPSGRSIQKPYIHDKLDEYDDDLQKRRAHGELEKPDSIKFADTTKYYTASGKIVHGGGGIMPDIFVPIDTLINNPFWSKAYGYTTEFCYDYLDKYRTNFEGYGSLQNFDQRYQTTPALFAEFVAFVAKRKVTGTPQQISGASNHLLNEIKAQFARQLYDENGYRWVKNQHDNVVKKALDLLSK
jgi:carboxyl-terminal processing protease